MCDLFMGIKLMYELNHTPDVEYQALRIFSVKIE